MTISESQYAEILEVSRNNLYATNPISANWRTCQGCGRIITPDEHGYWYSPEIGHYCPRTDVTADVYYTAILWYSTIHAPERYTSNA